MTIAFVHRSRPPVCPSTRLPVISLAACALACSTADVTTQWTGTISDSAGVTIVSNPAAGAWREGEAWSLEEDLRIGVMEGDSNYVFGRVDGICVGSDGKVHVLDGLASTVAVYDSSGAFLHSFGESGRGPGEFGMYVGPCLMSRDTLIIPDRSNRRINWFASDGSFLRSIRMDADDQQGLPVEWDMFGYDRVIQQNRLIGKEGEPLWDQLIVRGPDGSIADTLFEYQPGSAVTVTDVGERILTVFDAEPDWAATSDGDFWFGRGDEYRLELRDAFGELTRIVTKQFEKQIVANDDQQIITDVVRTFFRERGVSDAVAKRAVTVAFSEHYPAYHRLASGTRNSIWAQQVVRPSDWTEQDRAHLHGMFLDAIALSLDTRLALGSPDWDVFDAEGRFLGVVTMPQRFEPFVFVDDALYGVWMDDLDVEYVIRLKVVGL